MTLRDRLLPRLHKIREIPSRFGLRNFRVFLCVDTYTGNPDLSEEGKTTSETEILPRPRVVPLMKTSEEISASGGLLKAQFLFIPHINPAYLDVDGYVAGYRKEDLDPQLPGNKNVRRSVYVKIINDTPNQASEEAKYNIVKIQTERPFSSDWTLSKQ